MSIGRRGRLLVAFLFGSVVFPPFGPALEREMFTHMLVQMPVVFISGGLVVGAVARSNRTNRWNEAGAPALFGVSLVTAFWMIPIAIDNAVSSTAWDCAKIFSLAIAGAVALRSWRKAPQVVQVFFGGNLLWMTIVVGQLYQQSSNRLCNVYLQDDQALTGAVLTGYSIVIAVVWLSKVLWPCMRYAASARNAREDEV